MRASCWALTRASQPVSKQVRSHPVQRVPTTPGLPPEGVDSVACPQAPSGELSQSCGMRLHSARARELPQCACQKASCHTRALQGSHPPTKLSSGSLTYRPALLQLPGELSAWEDVPPPPDKPASETMWFNVSYERVRGQADGRRRQHRFCWKRELSLRQPLLLCQAHCSTPARDSGIPPPACPCLLEPFPPLSSSANATSPFSALHSAYAYTATPPC